MFNNGNLISAEHVYTKLVDIQLQNVLFVQCVSYSILDERAFKQIIYRLHKC